jgi:hypothetical protein
VLGISGERSLDLVNFILVLSEEGRGEGEEFEVGAVGPEEVLLGELKLISERYSHADVVVGLQAFNAAPEHKFFKVSFTALVEKSLDGKIQTDSKE